MKYITILALVLASTVVQARGWQVDEVVDGNDIIQVLLVNSRSQVEQMYVVCSEKTSTTAIHIIWKTPLGDKLLQSRYRFDDKDSVDGEFTSFGDGNSATIYLRGKEKVQAFTSLMKLGANLRVAVTDENNEVHRAMFSLYGFTKVFDKRIAPCMQAGTSE